MNFSGIGGLAGAGSLVGGLGQAYGAYQQSKIAKELLKMQKLDYKDEKARKKRSQGRLNLAADRAFSHKYDNASLPLAA